MSESWKRSFPMPTLKCRKLSFKIQVVNVDCMSQSSIKLDTIQKKKALVEDREVQRGACHMIHPDKEEGSNYCYLLLCLYEK
jgi:hypothetical protein